ncbi:MAG: MATE family efflux transporter [Alistipes sp.]|nr:MATE family efflux transporter [Alistipes sp.]
MNLFRKYTPFYKENLRLALPVILSQVGQITVQLADTAMVGRYGGDDPTPLAAVSFASSFFFIVFIAAMGLTFGLTPLVGEHFSQGKIKHTRKLLLNGMVLFTIIGVIATILLFAARALFPIMGALMLGDSNDASIGEVVSLALPYYDTLIWSVLPVMIWGSVKQFLEGIGNTRIAMVTIISANTLNIFLNWVFIFGKFGFEPMGAIGAGYATLISRICQCVMLVAYFFLTPRFKEYTANLISQVKLSWRTTHSILKVGVPISFQMLMEASAFVVAGILVLAFGATSVSAYQIGVNMMNVTFMIVVAIGSATTILCSYIYGRKTYARLRHTVNAAYQMGLVWNLTVATLYVLLRYQIPTLFTSNEEVIDITATMLIFIALFQISDCLQAISISILRGLQDVKIIMPIVVLSYVVINIPVGYFLAFNCQLKANGLIIGFIIGLSTCAVLTLLRVKRNIRQMELVAKKEVKE